MGEVWAEKPALRAGFPRVCFRWGGRQILPYRDAAMRLSNVQCNLVDILPTYVGGCSCLLGPVFEGPVRLTAYTPILSSNFRVCDGVAAPAFFICFLMEFGRATDADFCGAELRRMQRQRNRKSSNQRLIACRGSNKLGTRKIPAKSFQVSKQEGLKKRFGQAITFRWEK